jgi:hypothetical protein
MSTILLLAMTTIINIYYSNVVKPSSFSLLMQMFMSNYNHVKDLKGKNTIKGATKGCGQSLKLYYLIFEKS